MRRWRKKEPATPADAARLIGKAREVLLPSASGCEFARHRDQANAARPGGGAGHGEMMQVFAELARVKDY